MDNGRALLAGVVIVAAALWWYAGHPGYETRAQRQARIAQIEQAEGSGTSVGTGTRAGPRLYRCPGANGVNTITDAPPPGRKCTEVHIRDDQNVVSLQVDQATPPAQGKDKGKSR
jgi:hypothetical protein